MTRVVAAFWALLISTVASAQPAPGAEPSSGAANDAAKLFEEGRSLAKEGKYVEACQKFAKSYELDRGVGTELNLADCQEHLGRFTEAWRLFDDAALQSASNPARAKFARERANQVGKKVATVIVRIPDPVGVTVSIAGKPVAAAAEIRQRVDPGQVEVIVISPGRPTFKKKDVANPGEIVTVLVPGPAAAIVADPPWNSETPSTSTGGERARGRVHLAIGVGLVGAASLITSIVFGATANSQYNTVTGDLNQCTRTPQLVCTQAGAASVDHAIDLANVSTGFGVAAVALIGAGAVLYLTAPRETIVAPTASSDTVGITVARRF